MIEKYCLSCHQPGHIYSECPNIPFGSLLAGVFGVPDILGSPKRTKEEIAKAERYRNFLELSEEFKGD